MTNYTQNNGSFNQIISADLWHEIEALARLDNNSQYDLSNGRIVTVEKKGSIKEFLIPSPRGRIAARMREVLVEVEEVMDKITFDLTPSADLSEFDELLSKIKLGVSKGLEHIPTISKMKRPFLLGKRTNRLVTEKLVTEKTAARVNIQWHSKRIVMAEYPFSEFSEMGVVAHSKTYLELERAEQTSKSNYANISFTNQTNMPVRFDFAVRQIGTEQLQKGRQTVLPNDKVSISFSQLLKGFSLTNNTYVDGNSFVLSNVYAEFGTSTDASIN